VTLEHEARVMYLELLTSAKAMEVYVLHGGGSGGGQYEHVAALEGRRMLDHPSKYHYR
jgi:hypothetical protein